MMSQHDSFVDPQQIGLNQPLSEKSFELQFARAEQVQAATNAFSALNIPAAREAAAAQNHVNEKVHSDRPLAGSIVTVKDSFHVRDLPRWHGSATHPGALSPSDSVPVSRLRAAGAIIVGKTTMPDYGLLAAGLSSQFGITRNPWDLSASPGGSSSGAGAAVAAGVGHSALGTDIAGSVRLPAAHCGLVALKPTQGALAYAPASTWRSAGPMARTVRAARELFEVVGAPHPSDQLSRPLPSSTSGVHAALLASAAASGWTPAALRGLRVGVMESPGYGPHMDSETSTAFHRFLEVLRANGAILEDFTPEITELDFAALDRCLMTRCIAERSGCPTDRQDDLLPVISAWAESGSQLRATDYFLDFEHLSAIAARVSERVASYDIVVSPVMGVHRFAADSFGPDPTQPLLFHANYTAWFNQTGQPAVALPMARSTAGHPIGVQIAGPHGADFALLGIAEALEGVLEVPLGIPALTSPQAPSAA